MRLVQSKFLYAAAALLCGIMPLYAEQPVFSGIVESNIGEARGGNGGFTWQAEQYANLRMKAAVGDRAVIHAAVNADATSAKEEELSTGAELERLYFSINGDTVDFDAGFMRMAFGYGQAFRPSDFLNPPNPLYPDARQKGALGAIAALYPGDEYKVQLFGADRTDPYVQYPGFSRPLAGASGEIHRSEFSAQALYAIQTPAERGSRCAVNYCGASLKFDLLAGIAADTLYTYDSSNPPSMDGMQFALGADYSLLKGDLYLLGQYFFNGDGSLDTGDNISDLYANKEWTKLKVEQRVPVEGFSDFYRKHYLYLHALYAFDDFTRATASILSALEDGSFLPSLGAEYEPFQGMTLSLTAKFPLDAGSFGGSGRGELGADHSGFASSLQGSAKLRF